MNRFEFPAVPMNECNHGGSVKADGTSCGFKTAAVQLLPGALCSVRLAGVAVRTDRMDSIGMCCDFYSFSLDFGFSVLSKMFEVRLEPCGLALFPLNEGLCEEGRIAQSTRSVNEILCIGFDADMIACGVSTKGLCRMGNAC